MNKLNSTILEGNAVKKPELKLSPKGTSICVLPLAVDRYYKNASGGYDTEVSYFDVESYGKLAEFCAGAAEKGRGVRVVGRLKQNRWKTPEGENRSKIIVIAEHIEMKPLKKTEEISKDTVKSNSEVEDANEADSEIMQLKEAGEVTQPVF